MFANVFHLGYSVLLAFDKLRDFMRGTVTQKLIINLDFKI